MNNGGSGGRDRKLLDIHPAAELKFPFELKKQSSCSLLLTNKTANETVAFKFKTTNQEKYGVKPNMGIVLPGKTCDVIVTMQAQNDVPSPDVLSKEKILLQSVAAPHGATTMTITREMFIKEAGKLVEEYKFKVMYVIPPPVDPPSMSVLPYDVVKVKCQICDMDTHIADMCPFMYTTCKVSKCSGIRRLYISKITNNPDRKFLKCQYSKCMGIQWLSDAILEANGSSTSTASTVTQNIGCLQCGVTNNQCSCVASTCTTNNKEHFPAEIREPKTSKKESDQSRMFFKCLIPPKKVSKTVKTVSELNGSHPSLVTERL